MLKLLLDANLAIYTIKNPPTEVRGAFKAHDPVRRARSSNTPSGQTGL